MRRRTSGNRVFVFFMVLMIFGSVGVSEAADQPRLLILTDIGGDPDDIQSMRRLLVYSNEFRIEGLIATATPLKGEVRIHEKYYIYEDRIHKAIDDYSEVYPQFVKHSGSYPSPESLLKVVFGGQAKRGVENLQPGFSTAGSEQIIRKVDESDELLHVSIWGGAHDLAQALLDVKTGRSEEELEVFLSMLRVYAINDQDKKFHPEKKGTGEWIRAHFPVALRTGGHHL